MGGTYEASWARPRVSNYMTLVVPALHPAFIMRGQERMLLTLIEDLARAKRVSTEGFHPNDHVYICTPAQGPTYLAEALQQLRHWRETKTPCAIDVETTGAARSDALDTFKCSLRTVAVSGYGSDTAVAIPVGTVLDNATRRQFLDELAGLCTDVTVPKIFHNFSFDTTVLWRHGITVAGQIYDTVILHHVVEPELDHNLGFVGQFYLDTVAWKEIYRDLERKATLEDLLLYNGLDALRTQQLLGPLCRQTQERQLWPVVAAQTKWAYVARRMHHTGLPFHQSTWDECFKLTKTKHDAALEELRSYAGDPEFNPRKPLQARRYLYEKVHLPVRKRTKKTREPSTAIKAVLDFMHDPRVRSYVRWFEAASDLSALEGYRKRVHPDGRLRPSWNPTAQVGSRFGSTNPNLQNVPAHLRKIFRAPPGRKFVQADEEQLEYRLIAVLAGAKRLLEIFNTPGQDAHIEMARFVFGPSFDQMPLDKRKAIRTIVKRVVYALNYGAGPLKIVMSVREDRRLPIDVRALVTLPRVQKIHDGFFAANPEIKTWRENLLLQVDATGFIEIPPLGRRRYFTRPADRNKVFNWPVQTFGSDMVNLALSAIEDRLPLTARPLVHGHDAGLWECDESDALLVKQIVEEEMRFDLTGPAGPVTLIAEAEIVQAWYEDAPWPN